MKKLEKVLRKRKCANMDDEGENNTKEKRQAKGKAASNYRPITCLLLVWKLLTGVIAEEIYGFLETNLLLPQEQKGCRRKSGGTDDLCLLIRCLTCG